MTKALEKTYDGIVIGAGHHGLILGTYLAQAGLKILLVERRLTYGGGLCTREVTLPGFYHNLHSINHFHISETPWFKDLNLGERVTYITPRYEFGQAHRDGTALVLGRDLPGLVGELPRRIDEDRGKSAPADKPQKLGSGSDFLVLEDRFRQVARIPLTRIAPRSDLSQRER